MLEISSLVFFQNAATLSVQPASTSFLNKPKVNFTARTIKKTIGKIPMVIKTIHRVNCVRKASAEDYPKNFALLSLAEKTLAKARQHQQEMM